MNKRHIDLFRYAFFWLKENDGSGLNRWICLPDDLKSIW